MLAKAKRNISHIQLFELCCFSPGLSKRLNARCSRSAVGEREAPAPLPHHIRQRARTAKSERDRRPATVPKH